MLRSVLLVVDSGSAARVVQRAAQLPLTRNATITIAEDAGRRPPAIEIHALTLLAPGRTIQRHAVDSLHGFRLLDLAESCRAELVLIGDEGLFCWRVSALLGRVPVLLVRTARAEGYRHPLVAIEPSGTARVVLGFLRQLFPRRATRMNAVHVSTGSAEQARQVVASMLAELGAFGAGWTRYGAHGSVTSRIVDAARLCRADLVVIGARSRTAVGRLLFGSVSRSVLQEVSCDVLAVPVSERALPLRAPHAISEAL